MLSMKKQLARSFLYPKQIELMGTQENYSEQFMKNGTHVRKILKIFYG